MLRQSNSSGRISRIHTRWFVQCARTEENCWSKIVAFSLLLRCDFALSCNGSSFCLLKCLYADRFCFFARNLFVTAWSWYEHKLGLLKFVTKFIPIGRTLSAFIYERVASQGIDQSVGLVALLWGRTFEYHAYIELFLSRNQDFLLGASFLRFISFLVLWFVGLYCIKITQQ